VDGLADIPADAQPIADRVREQILAPVLTAVETALREVAMTEVSLRAAYRLPKSRQQGELVASLELSASPLTCLSLGLGNATASALAQRVLTGTLPNPDFALTMDCLAELVNVTGGQAKALFHGTPWQFTFGTPQRVWGGDFSMPDPHGCLVALLATDVGEVILQLFLGDPDLE
jgi:CheY-specific phosphatase CheX